MSTKIKEAFEKGEGIFRLIPNFVPRRFGLPGKRLKLHPDDYFALGIPRGAIKERWLSSVIPAINGPLAPADEGMSYVSPTEKIEDKFSLKAAIQLLGKAVIGEKMWEKHGMWPMYSKFFDFETPLFHHLHLDFTAAARIGMSGKPEAYYFPKQLNNHMGQFPVTYFGYDPSVSIDEVRERLLQFESTDTRITELSRAYRIQLGTGWYTPPGVVHAPGSCLTYEPQWNSDVNSVHENITSGEVYPRDFLVENCPEDKKQDLDYILGLMDWEKNVDPHYKSNYFRPPIRRSKDDTQEEYWITYANEYFSATELTIYPGQTYISKDPAAYGCILVQGRGQFGAFQAETPTLLRFGQLSADEYFVSEKAAIEGVKIVNTSRFEPLVILKHFADNHHEAPTSNNL